jgi:NAD(P)-dependent dehydrogenase (short-subunit alcohol dehydrogenase family)
MADGTNLPQRFAGKTALITGAGSGIGRAVCIRLAAEGAQVFGHDLNGDSAAETAGLVEKAGGTMQVRAGDVSSGEECRATVAACVNTFGGLDVLGNVAGVSWAHHFTDVTEAEYRKMMGVNTDGYFFMAQAAIPHLLERAGNIVNIASNAGLMGQAYTVVYTMTKGAVVQMTRSLAMEYVKTPLRVNAIAPGGTETGLTAGFQMPSDIDFDLMAPYSGFRGMGSATDIANMFAFVASDEAASVHGAILSVDRGVTAG